MSQDHAGGDHTHGMAKQTLRLAFFLTMLILAAELLGGFLSNSLALLSDAGHVLTDIFALGLAWFATVQAERPANASKTFGYHRVGILAAMINAVTLIVIALAIVWEAAQRFQHPEKVEPPGHVPGGGHRHRHQPLHRVRLAERAGQPQRAGSRLARLW